MVRIPNYLAYILLLLVPSSYLVSYSWYVGHHSKQAPVATGKLVEQHEGGDLHAADITSSSIPEAWPDGANCLHPAGDYRDCNRQIREQFEKNPNPDTMFILNRGGFCRSYEALAFCGPMPKHGTHVVIKVYPDTYSVRYYAGEKPADPAVPLKEHPAMQPDEYVCYMGLRFDGHNCTPDVSGGAPPR